MTDYYLVRYQDGGCDYTIGCGTAITKLYANSLEEAQRIVITDHLDDVALPGEEYQEFQLSDCYILVVDQKIDMMNPLLEAKQKHKLAELKAAAKEEKEARRREFEKLKKEFGNG